MVMPTFSASSVTLIFRLASITSMLMMIGILIRLYRQVVLRLQLYRALEGSFEYCRGGGDDRGDEDQ